jgi:cobalt-precorrin 5A hydrolase
MAVIGIGTTSRASAEDVLAVIAMAKSKMAEIEVMKTPSLCLSPQGERGRSFLARRMTQRPFSPRGEGQDEGGLAITRLAALDRPALNGAVEDAAQRAGLQLILLTLGELRAAAHLCVTHSEKSMKQYGIPSVAEAAALAAAGAGARLLLLRFSGRNTTASVAIVP